MTKTMNPDELFELFYQDVSPEMSPPGMPYSGRRRWWYERFMNVFYSKQEPYSLRGWAEAPQMWLRGYRRALEK